MEIKDVENLAEMAKIELTQVEKEKLLSDLEGVLNYVKQVQEVKIESIEPEYRGVNTLREDEPSSSAFSRDLILSQFPEKQDDYLKVQKVL